MRAGRLGGSPAVADRPVPNYRADIDGLRAVAVTIVVLFHLQSRFATGGFIGVDIFFVISGFLITKIVLVDLRGPGFSILTFYQRRVQRIFPALLVAATLTLLAGAWCLLPGAYASLGASTAAAMASGGNIFFYRNTGYFDAAAELAPLLHTWSLAVEEQFYIVWPLLLWAASAFLVPRVGDRAYVAVVAAVIVVSILCAQWQLQADPKAAFYLPAARAWELAVGGMLAVLPDGLLASVPRAAVEVADAGALAVVAVFTLAAQPGPLGFSLTAAAPVLAAVVLVAPHAQPTAVSRLLSLGPLRYLGQLSYSWYLYHWPVIVLWRHYAAGRHDAIIDATTGTALLVASLLAGWLSWRWVETPTRHVKWPRGRVIAVGYALSAVVAAAGLVVYQMDGFPSRIAADVQNLASGEAMWAWPVPHVLPADSAWGAAVQVGVPWASAARRAIVFGDSHSQHILPLLHLSGLRHNAALARITGCPVIVAPSITGASRVYGEPNYHASCETMLRQLRDGLVASPETDTVVFAAAWAFLPNQLYSGDPENPPRSPERAAGIMQQAFPRVLKWLQHALEAAGSPPRRWVILGDTPMWPFEDPVSCVIRSNMDRRATCNGVSIGYLPLSQSDELIDNVVQGVEMPGVHVVPVIDNVCSRRQVRGATRKCTAWLNGEFLYRDRDHYRRNLRDATVAMLLDHAGYDAVWTAEGLTA